MEYIKIVDGVPTPMTEAEIAELTAKRELVALDLNSYSNLRRAAYPSIGEQLDMIYKDKLDGGTRFVDAITAIKTLYPKP